MPAELGPQLYNAVDAAPYGDELVQALALRALSAENLGTGPKTDLLTVSYSSVDYVGHRDGPDSPEIHDMVKRVDKLIGALIDAAEARAGRGSVLVAFTADHGSTPVPEVNQKRKMPGGRLVWNTLPGRGRKGAQRKIRRREMDLFQRRRCHILQPGSDSGQEARYGRSPKSSCRYAPCPASHCARLYQNAARRRRSGAGSGG